jgi:hypothetical protein
MGLTTKISPLLYKGDIHRIVKRAALRAELPQAESVESGNERGTLVPPRS